MTQKRRSHIKYLGVVLVAIVVVISLSTMRADAGAKGKRTAVRIAVHGGALGTSITVFTATRAPITGEPDPLICDGGSTAPLDQVVSSLSFNDGARRSRRILGRSSMPAGGGFPRIQSDTALTALSTCDSFTTRGPCASPNTDWEEFDATCEIAR